MKIYKNRQKKEIENKIHLILSCGKMITFEGKHLAT